MQAVSHFHSELGLFMMFLESCFIVYFDGLLVYFGIPVNFGILWYTLM